MIVRKCLGRIATGFGMFGVSLPTFRGRPGFTLIELLVVLVIVLLLASLILRQSVTRDAVGQSSRAFSGALKLTKQRAAQAREAHGVTVGSNGRDGFGSSLLLRRRSGHRIRSEIPEQSVNFYVELCRPDFEAPFGDYYADRPGVTIVKALVEHQWEKWEVGGFFEAGSVRVRIPTGENGVWYEITPFEVSDRRQFVLSEGDWSVIQLATPVEWPGLLPHPCTIASPYHFGSSSLDLEFTTEPVPFSEPISLPAGVVIDLEWSSQSVRSLAEQNGAVQLMFSPRGNLVGPAGALGALHFLLTDRQDAELLDDIDAYNNTTGQRKPDGLPDVPRRRRSPIDPRNRYPKTIVSVIPQSGAVLTSPVDPTDLIDNVTGESGPDGLADDLFRFARTGAGGP